MCVRAHELIAEKCQYPLHVGITESGTVYSGNIKSSVGLGIILHEGIGNTIRVSLTGDPTEEIRTAKLILKNTGNAKRRDRSSFLPDLRTYQDRSDRSCKSGRKDGAGH